MRHLLLICFSFFSILSFAQDTTKAIEPERQSSFENYELLIIAIAGLAILMAMRYWFKRTRKK